MESIKKNLKTTILKVYEALLSGVDSIRIFIVESEAYMYLLQAMNLGGESLDEIKNNRYEIMRLSL